MMNAANRFFRRYVFSAMGILALFLAVNLVLAAVLGIVVGLSDSDSGFGVRSFSEHVVLQNGAWSVDEAALGMLDEKDAWAMLLDDGGDVVWEEGLPQELPRSYTVPDVAAFCRWYLEDYPVLVWRREDGLLVVGFLPERMVKYSFTISRRYALISILGAAGVFLVNLILMICLFWRNSRRVEKAMIPILDGIRRLSGGSPVRLEEKGELAEINAGLNRAGEYLMKKDNTRAEWIRGISHDIRTPLSMILGYAGEMEDNSALPEDARRQAGVIRGQGEKLKELIADLNLTTKLEYSVQPVQKQSLDPVELARRVAAEFLNGGLQQGCELEFFPGKAVRICGDGFLLGRMLSNLIRNCIVHNPGGCKITVSVGGSAGGCIFSVTDDGRGMDEALLKSLNSGGEISSTQRETDGEEHGLGLKTVRQIVRAHRGEIWFSQTAPHGVSVTVKIPPE